MRLVQRILKQRRAEEVSKVRKEIAEGLRQEAGRLRWQGNYDASRAFQWAADMVERGRR